jgi:hypothetical protein
MTYIFLVTEDNESLKIAVNVRIIFKKKYFLFFFRLFFIPATPVLCNLRLATAMRTGHQVSAGRRCIRGRGRLKNHLSAGSKAGPVVFAVSVCSSGKITLP